VSLFKFAVIKLNSEWQSCLGDDLSSLVWGGYYVVLPYSSVPTRRTKKERGGGGKGERENTTKIEREKVLRERKTNY